MILHGLVRGDRLALDAAKAPGSPAGHIAESAKDQSPRVTGAPGAVPSGVSRSPRSPAANRCGYPEFMSFSRLFGQVGALRMRPLLHAMRLLLFALLHAPEEGSADIDHFRTFLAEAQRAYATVLLILERPDAGGAMPAPE